MADGIVGRHYDVAVADTDVGGDYTEIGEMKSNAFSINNGEPDGTTNDSNGYKEQQYGDQQAAFSITCKYVSSDAAQAELMDAVANRTKKWFRFRPRTASGEREWRFQATLSSQDGPSGQDTETLQEIAVSGNSSGTIISTTQA